MHLDKKKLRELPLAERQDYLFPLRDALLIQSEFIENFREELSTFSGYNSDTKARINELAEEIVIKLNGKGNWIGHSVKTSRKRDLIGALDNIGHRVLQNNDTALDAVRDATEALEKDLREQELREEGRALMQRVYNETDWKQHRSEMDYDKAGNWDCFVDLVEDGVHITINNIADYGVELAS